MHATLSVNCESKGRLQVKEEEKSSTGIRHKSSIGSICTKPLVSAARESSKVVSS